MRWELIRGAERLRMVRAVDTATDPDHQGRGIFRRLTERALAELVSEGYDAVFNTPNNQSRPAYLNGLDAAGSAGAQRPPPGATGDSADGAIPDGSGEVVRAHHGGSAGGRCVPRVQTRVVAGHTAGTSRVEHAAVR